MTQTCYPNVYTPIEVRPEGIFCKVKTFEVVTPSNGRYGGWKMGQTLVPFKKLSGLLTDREKSDLRFASHLARKGKTQALKEKFKVDSIKELEFVIYSRALNRHNKKLIAQAAAGARRRPPLG